MCKRSEATFVSHAADTAYLAITKMGPGFFRSTSTGTSNLKYVVVAVEYFSKWIEANPLATITSATVQKFFWQNIVYHFGVRKAITVDNEHSLILKHSKSSVTRLVRKSILHQLGIRSQTGW
jgi:hypothetical protein